jgi:hypothetical protein
VIETKLRFVALLFLLLPIVVPAEVAPVAIFVPEARAWTGQRVPFFVALRARGSFAGSASFSLPDISRTVILKVGNPVVSSEDIEGESWFVQTHEFALFSQQSGTVTIPDFQVRFGSRDGFTGPVTEQQLAVPGARVEIRRPMGSEDLGFLVTTDELDLTEEWEPQPGPTEVGAVYKRTIVQRAAQMTGMALAVASTEAPDGVRVYSGQPEVADKTERGKFLGQRRETLTYLVQKPGRVELPALTYAWWNPKTEKLVSQTLPAVTFEVTVSTSAAASGESFAVRRILPWLLLAGLTLGLGIWKRRRVTTWLVKFWQWLNPAERRVARRLLRACRHHDPAAAQTAFNQWRNMQDTGFQPSPELQATVLEMQRLIFGPMEASAWQGDKLTKAFEAQCAVKSDKSLSNRSAELPSLNPG